MIHTDHSSTNSAGPKRLLPALNGEERQRHSEGVLTGGGSATAPRVGKASPLSKSSSPARTSQSMPYDRSRNKNSKVDYMNERYPRFSPFLTDANKPSDAKEEQKIRDRISVLSAYVVAFCF